jgi:hypothetical protein
MVSTLDCGFADDLKGSAARTGLTYKVDTRAAVATRLSHNGLENEPGDVPASGVFLT